MLCTRVGEVRGRRCHLQRTHMMPRQYDDRMGTKRRLSASIDASIIEAAESAVASGRAVSVSAWVNEACERQIDHERRLAAMDEFLTHFEAEFGEITDADIADASRRTSATAIVVRAQPTSDARSRSRVGKSADATTGKATGRATDTDSRAGQRSGNRQSRTSAKRRSA